MPGSVSFIHWYWIRVYSRVCSPLLGPCITEKVKRGVILLAATTLPLVYPGTRWHSVETGDHNGNSRCESKLLWELQEVRQRTLPNSPPCGEERTLKTFIWSRTGMVGTQRYSDNLPIQPPSWVYLTPSWLPPFMPQGSHNIFVLSELQPLAPRERWTAYLWPCVSWALLSGEEITGVFREKEW